MARVLEYITVNYAVFDQSEAAAKFTALGLTALVPNVMLEPPAQITDITFPMGSQGAISLVAPTDTSSTVQKFLNRRGEGIFSLAVRVDNLLEAMSEWPAYGIEWVLDKPYEFPPGTAAARYHVEKLKANWIKPGSLNGLLMECFEFCGNVKEIKP